MASCEEFFSRLRKLAVTVDKESSELKGILENSDISAYNENRACLLLRETLAEVKDCKKEVNGKVEEVQQTQLFEYFISVCGRLMIQTKEQINKLETHMEKYGYTRPKETLPDLTYLSKTGDNFQREESSAMETSEISQLISSSEQTDNSDGNISFKKGSDTEQDTPMDTDHSEKINYKENVEDLLKSPVPPETFTKMIEVTPPRPFGPKQGILPEKGQMTPCLTPQAPQTTTPMIKTRLAAYTTDTPTDNVLTPQGTHLPPQPTTVTPMIKPSGERVKTQSSLSPEPGSPDLPMPPIMGTPGLRAFSPLGLESPRPEVSFSLDNLPTPPDITSVQILKPGNIIAPPPVQTSCAADHNRHTAHMFVQPLNEKEYSILPVYVANQFSLECINQHLNTINTFLSNNEDHLEPAMLEQDLRNLLGLGAATKSYMLALVKTKRLKLAGKGITFLNSA